MSIWIYCLIGVLLLIIIALLIKIKLMQKSTKQIKDSICYILSSDTNILIDISSRDKHLRSLANVLNKQLQSLREAHHRFHQGDTEIKNALSNISHDLRTPLTAIFGYLDLLEQIDKSDDVKRYIGIIKNRTELMMQLTEELFQYSIILSANDGLQTEPLCLNSVLEESLVAFYTNLTQQGIIPTVNMPNKQIMRCLNKSALSRVFSNIISNALKYSDGDLQITLVENGTIVFTNTSSTLNNIQLERMFDRYYTVKTASNSTGLGLAIARTLVEQMNGTITATYDNPKLSVTISFNP